MKISIIIPTFNRAESLKETLASIGCQRHHDFEVIVVDNGPSTDETKKIVEGYKDLPAYYVPTPVQGVVFARNIGAKKARGSIYLQVDDDIEFISPDSLEKVSAIFSEHEQIGIIGGIEIRTKNEIVPINYDPLDQAVGRIDQRGKVDAQFKLINGHGITSVDHVRSAFMAIRKSCFDAVGGFDEAYHAKGMLFRGETDLCLKVIKDHGKRVVVDPSIKIWHKAKPRARGFHRGKGKDYFYYSNRNHVFFMNRFFWGGSLSCLTRDVFIGAGRTPGLYPWLKGFIKSPGLGKLPLITASIQGKLAGYRMFLRRSSC